MEQYDWKEIHLPLHKKYWKKFELNDNSIALNILYVPYNTKKIRHAYKSKYDEKHENKIILLMITDGKKMTLSCCKKIISIIWSNNI